MTEKQTVLGLDIGVASIGWALLRTTDGVAAEVESIAQGVRIIPYKVEANKPTDGAIFIKGGSITINKDRTLKRTVRKGLDRYKKRKKLLVSTLQQHGLYAADPALLPEWTPLTRWKHRATAAAEKIELLYLGRVLLHLNAKRGFRGSRKDVADKETSKYKNAIKTRTALLNGRTIGQFLYDEMLTEQQHDRTGAPHDNSHFDTKNRIYNRADYEAEMLQICTVQAEFYPEILTDDCIAQLRSTMYYQRPLRSQKHLISYCRYESREIEVLKKDGKPKKIQIGAKTAPLSNPLSECI